MISVINPIIKVAHFGVNVELSLPPWTEVTKIPDPGGLNSRHLFLMALDLEKSKIKVPADLLW